jgi:hypothetical protein
MMNYTFDIDKGSLITNESDEHSTVYFAIATLSLILFLGLCSWTRWLVLTSQGRSHSALVTFYQVAPGKQNLARGPEQELTGLRLCTRVVNRSVPGLPFMEHLLVVLVYVGVNLILLFVHVRGTSEILVSNYARRFGC